LKKKIGWAVLLVVSHILILIGGSVIGRHDAIDDLFGQAEKADAQVALGRYTIYRDMAKDIKTGRYERAQCSARLGASSMYDNVKTCLAKSECRDSIEKKAHEVAPELLGEVPLEFEYLESKNGIRHCGENVPNIYVKPAR